MSMIKRQALFFDSAKGVEALRILQQMTTDDTYNTAASYSADTVAYPNNLIPFVDKHMNYLSMHQSTNPEHYIANLRLMTRLR